MKRLLLLLLAMLSMPAAVLPPKASVGPLENLPAELKREILIINAQSGNRPKIDALAKGLLRLSHTNKLLRTQINSLPNILTILNSLPKSGAVYLVEKLAQTPVIQNNMLAILQALPKRGAKYLEKVLEKTPGMQRPEVKNWLISIPLKSGQPFFNAVSKRDWQTALAVLEDPATDINERDQFGYAPLMWAISSNKEKIVNYLLNEGASINVKAKNGETPLMQASAYGHPKLVALLLNAGANIDNKALLSASENLYPEVVKLLLNAGADFSIQNHKGRTALDLARKNISHDPQRAQEIIKLLEEAEKAKKEKN